MTKEEKENLAHNNYPYGSEMPIGSRDRSLYENKKESFLNGLKAAINYTHCCKSEQLRFLIDKFQTPKGNYLIELLMAEKERKDKKP
jgi:hypothetical protein